MGCGGSIPDSNSAEEDDMPVREPQYNNLPGEKTEEERARWEAESQGDDEKDGQYLRSWESLERLPDILVEKKIGMHSKLLRGRNFDNEEETPHYDTRFENLTKTPPGSNANSSSSNLSSASTTDGSESICSTTELLDASGDPPALAAVATMNDSEPSEENTFEEHSGLPDLEILAQQPEIMPEQLPEVKSEQLPDVMPDQDSDKPANVANEPHEESQGNQAAERSEVTTDPMNEMSEPSDNPSAPDEDTSEALKVISDAVEALNVKIRNNIDGSNLEPSDPITAWLSNL